MKDMHQHYLSQAVSMAKQNRVEGGRPFAAILVKDEKVLATGLNEMNQTYDASSHAELEAIRTATKQLGDVNLEGSVIYASGHPCPMCLAAIIMTNIKTVIYAFDNDDAEPFGFSSEATYQKLGIKKEMVRLELRKLDVGVSAKDLYS